MPEMTEVKTLRDRRIEAGLTCKQVGQKIGAVQSAVSQWETGASQMRPVYVPQLAKLYKCTPGEVRQSLEASGRDAAERATAANK